MCYNFIDIAKEVLYIYLKNPNGVIYLLNAIDKTFFICFYLTFRWFHVEGLSHFFHTREHKFVRIKTGDMK